MVFFLADDLGFLVMRKCNASDLRARFLHITFTEKLQTSLHSGVLGFTLLGIARLPARFNLLVPIFLAFVLIITLLDLAE